MPAATRGEAKDQRDTSAVAPDGAPENSAPADVATAGPFDDGNGNFSDQSVEGAVRGPGGGSSARAVHDEDGAYMGTKEKTAAMQAVFGQMEAMRTAADRMQATQALRDGQASADQEKMSEYPQTPTAAIKRGTSETGPPAETPTREY